MVRSARGHYVLRCVRYAFKLCLVCIMHLHLCYAYVEPVNPERRRARDAVRMVLDTEPENETGNVALMMTARAYDLDDKLSAELA